MSNGPQLTFGDGFATAFAAMDALEEVHLTGHVLNGSWPTAFGVLPKLRVVHLSGSAAAGATLPDAWSKMPQLQSLWLLDMGNLQGMM
jgi:hypothetical protein